ncbi:Maf family protein [Croceibacterium sp. TMG7-5b_MA50]|uniref:Maf family protein n=1 Tax=Croceibacterium sp. TMG7-5b_MA50 TaxID=3121290 RepID=UPI0032218F99
MIVLASGSASRRAMLSAAGVSFTVTKPVGVDERALEAGLAGAAPPDVARALASAKAEAVWAQQPGALVLGSDSLVVVAGRRFDKPASRAEAAEHLRFFSGQELQLHSAAALVRGGQPVWSHAALARLQVRALSEAFIEAYLVAEWPEIGHCAGAFRMEGLGVQLFETVAGDQFTILGMPLLPVLGALREQGELAA